MKRIFIILTSVLGFCAGAYAQQDSLKVIINDYSMLGVQYGVGLSKPIFQPERICESLLAPVNVGIFYTQYGKLFGYMPYFGFQIGLMYNQDGYRFKINEKTGGSDCILGARQAFLQSVKLPFLAHFHVDFWKMKLMASLGVYAGYRLSIKRSDYISGYYEPYAQYENSFHPNEKRFTYGAQGGAGFALVLDPIEIHFTAMYDFGFQNFHKPNVNGLTLEHDDNSRYYYKWIYPGELIFSVGVHYQLTRREGLTRKVLKAQAMEEARQIYLEAKKKLEENTEIKDEEIDGESR